MGQPKYIFANFSAHHVPKRPTFLQKVEFPIIANIVCLHCFTLTTMQILMHCTCHSLHIIEHQFNHWSWTKSCVISKNHFLYEIKYYSENETDQIHSLNIPNQEDGGSRKVYIYILQRRHLSPQKIKLIQFLFQILKITFIFHETHYTKLWILVNFEYDVIF